ncbi:Holliday junction resolvase RuvX [Candidatus Dependentiae bacterium]|nr:Holliday junction resolvase RuvX [Candidatus Dependentiae bacterium]
MSKIMALDLGDQWVGVALSDSSRIFPKPYTTVTAAELEQFLSTTLQKETIGIIVIGYPKTMSGGESDQTKKVVAYKELLETKFADTQFVLWDERLSSKRAQVIGSRKTKEDKIKSHSVAAAFILDSYLSYLHMNK